MTAVPTFSAAKLEEARRDVACSFATNVFYRRIAPGF
jgi:hypothetical protein